MESPHRIKGQSLQREAIAPVQVWEIRNRTNAIVRSRISPDEWWGSSLTISNLRFLTTTFGGTELELTSILPRKDWVVVDEIELHRLADKPSKIYGEVVGIDWDLNPKLFEIKFVVRPLKQDSSGNWAICKNELMTFEVESREVSI